MLFSVWFNYVGWLALVLGIQVCRRVNKDAMAEELSESRAEKAESRKIAWDAVKPGITFFLQ